MFFNALTVAVWLCSMSLAQSPASLMEERIDPAIDVTYADAVETFCERSVFPTTMRYRDTTLTFDHCIIESMSRSDNSYRWVCRAKYSGEIDGYLFSPERVRLEFSDGRCSVNSGDLQGAIETESIVRWMEEENPFQRADLTAPRPIRRYDAVIFHPGRQRLHLFIEEFFYTWDPQNNELSRRMEIAAGDWTGITPCVDAAVYHPRMNRLYFFRRNRYDRFNFTEGKGLVDRTGAIGIDGWWRLWTTGIDCALLRSPDEIVFFRNEEFRRFLLPNDFAQPAKKRREDPLWSKLPDGRIDAAFVWDGKLNFLIDRELIELNESQPDSLRRGQPRDFGWNFR
jgi:hypothetical protein